MKDILYDRKSLSLSQPKQQLNCTKVNTPFYAGSAFLNSPDPMVMPMPDFEDSFFSGQASDSFSEQEDKLESDETTSSSKGNNDKSNALFKMLKLR